MLPVLFEIPGFELFGQSFGRTHVYSYAALMALGYVAALLTLFFVSPKVAKEGTGGLERPQVWDLFIVMLISSLLASKVGHVLFEAPAHEGVNSIAELLKQDPLHAIRLGEPGYVWYGGMIGALLTALYYFKKRPHLDAWLYADAFAPSIMIGASVGRLGCFLAGCCHGAPTDAAWGVWFPQLDGPVHPTQLYDSFVAGAIGAFLLWRFSRRRFKGENLAFLLLMYPLARATTEIFRGDAERGALGALSTSQWLSLPLFAIGLYLYWARSKVAEAPDTPMKAKSPSLG